MIREMNGVDYEGNKFTIHAIKNELFSKYEFLVPNEYKMVYFGEYSGDRFRMVNDDFDENTLGLVKEICVVNLHPKLLADKYACWPINQDADIEHLKMIVAYCDAIKFLFNESGRIDDCIVYFTLKSEADMFSQRIVLSEPDDTNSILLRENY